MVMPPGRAAVSGRLPGDVAFVLFALAQMLDGTFSYVGLVSFGHSIEGNPLLAWYVATYGEATALIGAKLMALGCGAILHLTAMHRTLALLTAVYVVAALWTWSQILFAR
jgi:hypothetical protein